MRQLWETPGGVHPPENKVQSLKLGIGYLTIPSEADFAACSTYR